MPVARMSAAKCGATSPVGHFPDFASLIRATTLQPIRSIFR